MINGAPLFWAYQAVFFAYVAFGIGVALRSAWARLAKLFFVALLATALWSQVSALAMYDILPYWAYSLAATLRDASWLVFCLGLMHTRLRDSRNWQLLLLTAIALVLLECAFETGALPETVIAGVRLDSSLTHVFIAVFGVFLVENIARNSSRAQLWALKHWAIGLLAILTIELASRIPEFLTHTPETNLAIATPLIFLIALPFFVVSLTRLPQVNLRVHSSRTFVFHTATLIAAGVLLQGVAVASWYVRAYGGSNGTAIQVIVAFAGVAAVAAILVSSSIRSRFRRFIDENFFSLKYDYRVVWEKVIRGLDPERTTAERILSVFCDLMDSPGGAIWFWRESWQRYVPAAQTGVLAGIAPLPEQDPGMAFLRDGEQSFVNLADDAAGEKLFAAWHDYVDDAWIIVPLRHRSSIVGIAILKRPRAPRKLDWEEQGLVRLVALQLAAHFVQEETAQSLADARQLEDFNKRFAFVVHDIKNTIGQLSLLVGNIAQFGEQKEFRDDMVITLGNSVERLQSLLKSLTSVGTALPRDSSQPIDIKEFLWAFTKDKQKLGYNVILDPGEMTPSPFKTDSATLRRVLDHVVSNAVEASNPGGRVEIALAGTGEMVRITITDHGRGMTEQFIRDELFRMMRTTKGGGFGIGGYQIRQLMRDLGGEVTVDSLVGQGTCVTLSIPQFAGAGTP